MQDGANCDGLFNHLLTSVLGGEIVTLLTRKFSNTPFVVAGATHYGYPFPWLIRLQIPAQYFPWRIAPLNFFPDIAVWSVVVAIALLALQKTKQFPR